MKTIANLLKFILGTALTLSPALALAHTGADPHTHSAGFLDGFTHPFTGLDHLAAMLAVGLWSALAVRPAWLAPLAFVAVLVVGALAGMAGFAIPVVEPMIAASLLVVGLLLAWRRRVPAAVAAALAGTFAFFHGAAHGVELAGGNAASLLAGMVLATALLHGAGLLLGHRLLARSQVLAVGAGAGVALFGAALLLRLA